MAYTLPAHVVLDTFCSALHAHHEQLHHRERCRPTPERANEISKLSEQIQLCKPMLQDKRLTQLPEVDAVAAALLCDWASGDMTALGTLEERLLEIQHPATEQVATLQPWHWAEGVRLVVFR